MRYKDKKQLKKDLIEERNELTAKLKTLFDSLEKLEKKKHELILEEYNNKYLYTEGNSNKYISARNQQDENNNDILEVTGEISLIEENIKSIEKVFRQIKYM